MRISVIAPVYNGEGLLPQFTESLLSQTLKPWEVVLVDDGSTDGTDEVLRLSEDLLRRSGIPCQIVVHDRNRGRGASRNRGLDAATGDYVCWLDIDDLYGPERIAHLAKALATAEGATSAARWLISSPYMRIQAKDLSNRAAVPARGIAGIGELFEEESGPATLQLQALAGPLAAFAEIGFDETMNWAEDFDFSLRFLANGGVILVDHESRPEDILYFQSFRSADRELVMRFNDYVFEKHQELLRSQGVDPVEAFERKRQRYLKRFRPVAQSGSQLLGVDGASGQINLGELRQEIDLRRHGVDWVVSVAESGFVFRGATRPAGPVSGVAKFWDPQGQEVASAALEPAGQVLLPRSLVLYAIHRGAVAGEIQIGSAPLSQLYYTLARSTEGILFPIPQRSQFDLISNFSLAAPKAQSRFVSRFSNLQEDGESTVFISFFSGHSYYEENARRLADQLASYGVDFDICEYSQADGETWLDICRQKIAFYKIQSDRHQRPVMWIDIDTHVTGDPIKYTRQQADLGAFLRNFKYLVKHDPLQFSRLLHPGYLFFGNSPRTRDFLIHLLKVVETAPANATDDYVLQEGLNTFPQKLEITLFSPDDIKAQNEETSQPNIVFQHGDSGNVKSARAVAVQHQSGLNAVWRQKAVLKLRAKALMEKARYNDAAVYLRDIRDLDRSDVNALTSLLRAYSKAGKEGKYKYHFDKNQWDPLARIPILKVHLDHLFAQGKIAKALEVAQVLGEEGSPADAAFAQSRLFRHTYDIDASKSGATIADRIDMFWWEMPYPGNLGDIIGPYIVHKLSGLLPRFSTSTPRLLSVGSIIKFAKPQDTIWGSGASAADQKVSGQATIRAVRGPLTRKLLHGSGISCPEVYGDPAWFLPKVYDCSNVRKTHKLGVIQHFIHADNALAISPEVREINIVRGSVQAIETFLQEMNSCEAIISTSLHGVIIANAYGIPACWAVDSRSTRQIHGDGMKFRDYALSVGRDEFVPFDLASVDHVTESLVKECVHNPRTPIDLLQLAAAAPFEVKVPERQLAW